MTCAHHLDPADPSSLCCQRDEHTDLGHVYLASSAPDGHDLSEQAAEARNG